MVFASGMARGRRPSFGFGDEDPAAVLLVTCRPLSLFFHGVETKGTQLMSSRRRARGGNKLPHLAESDPTHGKVVLAGGQSTVASDCLPRLRWKCWAAIGRITASLAQLWPAIEQSSELK